jgi:hypothetical protein
MMVRASKTESTICENESAQKVESILCGERTKRFSEKRSENKLGMEASKLSGVKKKYSMEFLFATAHHKNLYQHCKYFQ